MRTKTLLLAAALTAAGVATSMAQVYSVNAVGYVNTTLKPGFTLVSNPLNAADNSIRNLFKGVPSGTQVYKYTASGYVIATYDSDLGDFDPEAAAATTVVPGEGVFVKLPAGAPVTITFVGEVPQGTALDNPLPAGLSIRSSIVPQAGTAADLGLVGAPGDQLYQYDNTTGYYISTFDADLGDWDPSLKSLKVGEAFFLRKKAAGTWHRSFSVNG